MPKSDTTALAKPNKPRYPAPSEMDGRLAALVAQYEDSDDLTTIRANLDALEGTRACTCCHLAIVDEKAHAIMSAMLARKETYQDVAGYLRSCGHQVSISMVSRHTVEHLHPGLLNVAVKAGALERISRSAFGIPSGDLSEMTMRAAMVPLLLALDDMDVKKAAEKYKKMMGDDIVSFAEFLGRMSKSLAAIKRSNNQAAVMDAKLELDKLRIKQGYDRMFQTALQEMVAKLSATDEGKAMLPALQRLLTTPAE